MCESIAISADDLSWDFGELKPRQARKQAHAYFNKLGELTRSLSKALSDFDLAAALQAESRDTYENVLTVIESIGASAECASKV